MMKKNEGVAQCDPLLEEGSPQPGGADDNAKDRPESAGTCEGTEKPERGSPLRCAIYVRGRVADPGNKAALDALEQEVRIRERIARDPTLVVLPKVYSDDPTSSHSNRPGLQALFRDVAAGLVDQIATYYPYDVIPADPDAADLLRCLEKRPRVKILSALNTITADMLDEGFTLHVNGTYVLEHPGYRPM